MRAVSWMRLVSRGLSQPLGTVRRSQRVDDGCLTVQLIGDDSATTWTKLFLWLLWGAPHPNCVSP
jgi:hypothetical protein